MKLGRAVLLVHRWLGSTLSGLLFVWFASGAVMLFAGYPRLDEAERWNLREPLFEAPGASPADVLPRANLGEPELISRGGRAAFVIERDGRRRAIDARTGVTLPMRTADDVESDVARRFAAPRAQVIERLAQPDQWTLSPRLATTFPLHRVALRDEASTEIYVCAASGEIVQRTTRSDRILAWFGAIPHWIYPTILRRHAGAWRMIVLVLAGLGLAACLAGLVTGVRVLRRTRGGVRSPFRRGATRLHHLLGLGFGVFASTWLLSGALSLHPFGLGESPAHDEMTHVAFGTSGVRPRRFTRTLDDAVARCGEAFDLRGMRLIERLGRPYFLCQGADGSTRLVSGSASDPGTARRQFDESFLRTLAAYVRPAAEIVRIEWKDSPDAYHYGASHGPPLRLPYVRITYRDRETTAYLDPARGSLLRIVTPAGRLYRWLYHGLHSFDFAPLRSSIPTWRTALLAAMMIGSALSLTGLVLTVRLARRRLRRRAR